MNLREYIDSNGNTVFHKFEKTFVAAQRIEAFEVIENFIREQTPEKILEIGTAAGGLTAFINHVGKEANNEFEMISTDINDRSEYKKIIEDVAIIRSVHSIVNKEWKLCHECESANKRIPTKHCSGWIR